jgi:hypothetical protein
MKLAVVRACGKLEEQKYILSLSLELVKVNSFDFPHPQDGPEIVASFLNYP